MYCNYSHYNHIFFILLCFSIQIQDGLHTLHITIKYKLNATDVILDLQLNDNMIPEGHFLKYQLPNGDRVVKNLTKTEVELCHYQVSFNTKA